MFQCPIMKMEPKPVTYFKKKLNLSRDLAKLKIIKVLNTMLNMVSWQHEATKINLTFKKA